MKKMLLSAIALTFMAPAMGRVDTVSKNLVQELEALPTQDQTIEQKLSSFEKAVEYLKGARDCLSGIGCTKRQSYLANYLLGATYGLAQQAAFVAIAQKDLARWEGNPRAGQMGLGAKLAYLQLLVNELGYRYLVKEKVHLFRCLTFRGCTDQTKRYAFYNLGIWSGRYGPMLVMINMAEQKRQKPAGAFLDSLQQKLHQHLQELAQDEGKLRR